MPGLDRGRGGVSQGTRIIQSCARQGYNPLYVVPASAYQDVLLKLAKAGTLKHLSVPSDTFLWFPNVGNQSSTSFKNYQAALKQYAKGTAPGPPSALGWISGQLFAAAGKSFGDTVTNEDVLTGLYALNGETLDGLAPQPLTYTKGKFTSVMEASSGGAEGQQAPGGQWRQTGVPAGELSAQRSERVPPLHRRRPHRGVGVRPGRHRPRGHLQDHRDPELRAGVFATIGAYAFSTGLRRPGCRVAIVFAATVLGSVRRSAFSSSCSRAG